MQRALAGAVTRPSTVSAHAAPAGGTSRHAASAAAAVALAIAFGLAAGGARAADTPRGVRDPLEHLNRATYAFNDALDRMMARPAARAYKKVVPRVLREAASNFLGNLEQPTVALNDALQGKLRAAGHDVARFAINTTAGIGGLMDPATRWGFTANDEDFGQTLGVWGVGTGPYLVVPILGPSNFRDAPARFVDRYTNPAHYVRPTSIQYYVLGGELLDRRAQLLALDATVDSAYDPYIFVRNSYLQRREYRVRDGNMPEEKYDDALPPPAADGAPAAATPASTPAEATPAAATPAVSAEPSPPPAAPPPR